MSKQRIIGVAIAMALAFLTVWQTSDGNWLPAAIAALGTASGFLPAVHKGEK